MRRRFKQGLKRIDIENAWQAVDRTRQKVELVVGTQKIEAWLDECSYRRAALAVTGKATHGGLTGDPAGAVKNVQWLVRDLRALP